MTGVNVCTGDQRTRFTERRCCAECGAIVLHYQVANFDRITGFKTYALVAIAHRCKTTPKENIT